MSEVDCTFDPTNAACANGNPTASLDNSNDGSLDWTKGTDPMSGQISYLTVAASTVVYTGL
jgi:hypothetical protein